MNSRLLLASHQLLMTLLIVISGPFSKNVIAQDVAIKGKVTSSSGESLAGASVIIKGTRIGTTTNRDGNFQINAANKNAVLVISFAGFAAKEVPLNGNTTINVRLEENSRALDAVVVVGYGTQRRRDLTGAVETVDMKDLTKAPVASFSEALAGRVAGVQVSANDAQPGSTPNIIIRGAGSLTQSSAPLYVVDGFPLEDFIPGSISNADIVSINILKDASATAIYGARAANGVVVIETKRGRAGKLTIDFNNSIGFQKVGKFIELMSPYEFVKYNYEFNPTLTTARYFTNGKTLESYRNEPGIDWQKEIFKTTNVRIHDLSLRGGNNETKYSLSGSIYDQGGVIRNTGSERYQGRVSIDQKIGKKLTVGINANYSSLKNTGVQVATSIGGGQESSFLFFNIWGYRPVSGQDSINLLELDVDPDNIGVGSVVVNPVKGLENTYNVATTKSLLTNVYLTYSITENLIFKATGGLDNRDTHLDQFFNSLTPQGSPKNPNNVNGINAFIRSGERNTWSNENTLNYKKTINTNHSFDLLGGFSLQQAKQRSNEAGYKNIPDEKLGISGATAGTRFVPDSLKTVNTLVSFFGRINYNFKSKYLLTATFRGDGTSKFATGKKWGYFPSAALAWNISSESFMKGLPFVSNAKLRTSYGVTGNNRVSDFAYLPSLSLPEANGYSFNNTPPIPGTIPTSLGNRDLTWETTYQSDIGLDLGFLNNRIAITADVYRKTTTDLLLNANLPASTGFTTVYSNIGELKNEGLELSLNTFNIQSRNFTWETNFNITFNRNKVLALTRGQDALYSFPPLRSFNQTPLWVALVGGPAASFYGYVWEGVYQYSDFDSPTPGTYILKPAITTNGTPRAQVQPGDIKYKDLNADLVVDDKDRTVIGRGLPKHTGGFTNNFRYKGFDLNAFFQWSYGNDIMNFNRVLFEGNAYNLSDKNQFASYINRWTPTNPSTINFRAGGAGPVGRISTRTLEDGSYLRLKTLSFGYNIPKDFIKKAHLSNLRIGIAAQNLITWTKYTGMDPEVSVRNTILTPGYDYSAYPNYKTVVFSLNASF